MSDTMEPSCEEILEWECLDTKSLLMTNMSIFCCLKMSKLHLTPQRSPTVNTISLAGRKFFSVVMLRS
ncbi:hypothetical protein LOD99_15908 [Oopsacas minuta]|uniref:Uncharacterized protein n=1 Tax=Oopsacas minuta TaxID=111878 RepID=A0AAV7K794_9METZ|nr:hypothetical protein LOD99_15908 [Oopsacas minuta]